tara:strand:- start:4722 stop:5459 length:738 start_codon:yes stop_codon:yes gene_type:complete
MPINVDTVYQTVQALANKEQRGYLTPQEFNLFAIQAQKDIFEQYLYDLTAAREANRSGVDELIVSNKNILFKINNTIGVSVSNSAVGGGTTLPIDAVSGLMAGYTGKIMVVDDNNRKRTVVKIDDPDQIYDLLDSKWHQAGFSEIVYFDDGVGKIQVWTGTGQVTSNVTCESITGEPQLVYWGYIVVNEKAVYDPLRSQNFSLHNSEQADVVAKILKLAGISMEDQELYQAGAAEEALNLQQENR